MMLRTDLTAIFASVVVMSSMHARAEAQDFTESHDPLRGVTFYSVQISTDSLTDLQILGQFGSGDRLTLGVSAFFFDESDTADEYVLWLHHDGPRRWFTAFDPQPLQILVDRVTFTPRLQHIFEPSSSSDSEPLLEKLEFPLRPSQFQTMLSAKSVAFELITLLGLVEKQFTDKEIAAIQAFDERVRLRHDEARARRTPSSQFE